MLIDTHCHLDAAEFDPDRDAVLANARAAGVRAIVVPAVDVGNFDAVRALAAAHSDVGYALGIHPMYVDRAGDADLARLHAALTQARGDPKLVAIGEIGLDHFVPGLDRERQRRFYVAQLQFAVEFDLPVLLHVRRAIDPVLRELRRLRVPGGIAHAFNGSAQQAQVFIDHGFALGFGGAISFERATRIRGLAARLADCAPVLETDAPDMTPAWRAPARNTPAELPRIAAVLADLRAVTPDEVATVTGANALRVLPRLRGFESLTARAGS